MPGTPKQLRQTEGAKAELSRRIALVKSARELIARGSSMRSAAALLSESPPTLHRYLKAFEKHGEAGLALSAIPGRPEEVARLKITPREVAAMASQVRGRGIAKAVRAYARSPECRPALAKALLRSLPDSLRAAIERRLANPTDPIPEAAPAPPPKLSHPDILVLPCCPFCFGQAIIGTERPSYGCRLSCEQCKACGPIRATKEAAIKAWARRHTRVLKFHAAAGVVEASCPFCGRHETTVNDRETHCRQCRAVGPAARTIEQAFQRWGLLVISSDPPPRRGSFLRT